MSVTGSISITSKFIQSIDAGPLTGSSLPALVRTWLATFATGNLAGQVNRVHFHTYTFVASTPQTINLKSLTDLLGATFTDLAIVRGWGLRLVSSTDAATLEAGKDGTANEWVGMLTAGSSFLLRSPSADAPSWSFFTAPGTTGFPVGTTNRLLKLTPSAHAFDVDLIVAGSN